MTLQQLKYVTTVAQTGTISDAAKKLFISQPSLTKAVRELEKEMEITIFERTNRGIVISKEGETFLGYARQVLEQAALLGETQTYEIIEDVAQMKSEIGILYLNDFNRTVLEKLIKEHDLVFTELFVAKPHIFVSTKNPLAGKKSVTIEELEPYPYLSFEQGEHNSFYFSEEIFSTVDRPKNIRVRDRATLFNLLIGLNGYTVCSGVIDEELNGENIVSVPLQAQGNMHIGMVTHKKVLPSRLGAIYREALVRYTQQKI